MFSSTTRGPRSLLRQFLRSTSRQLAKPRIHARLKSQQAPQQRIDRINSRLPRFLQNYTSRLRAAPLSHITSFLVLHELTAIVPLFALAATFHYTQWLPPYISEWKYAKDGVEKFGNYFRRKGWLGDADDAGAPTPDADAAPIPSDGKRKISRRARVWGWGEGGVQLVVEFATAYAVTKALLPLRLAASVAAAPWFARIAVVPATGLVKRLFRRSGPANAAAAASPAAGTNAVGGGALGK